MALQVAGAAQVKLYWSINDNLVINVAGAAVAGSPAFGQGLADALGASVKSAFTANLAPRFAPTSQLMAVGVRDLRTANQPEFIDGGAPVAGTGTGDALPAGIAQVITIRTAQTGKSFRGRNYVSGWSEAENLADGLVSPAANTALTSFWGALASAMISSGLQMGVISYPSEEKFLNETTVHADGTSTVRLLSHTTAKTGRVTLATGTEIRNNTWEHQRRRDNGRGASPASLLNRNFSSLTDLPPAE